MQRSSRREFLGQASLWGASAWLAGGLSAGAIPSAWASAKSRPQFSGAETEPLGSDLSPAELARFGLAEAAPAHRLERARGGDSRLPSESVDVVILGGGFAGVLAARKLREAGKSFLLLESRDRIGGRTFSKRYGQDLILDAGGQWIGPGQDRVLSLTRELKIETFKMYDQGTNLLDLDRSIEGYTGALPGFGQLGFKLLDFGQVWWRLDRMASRVDLSAPWKADSAREWDDFTLGEWIRKNCVSSQIASLMRGALEMVFAADLDQISLLHALFYIRSGGGLDSLTRVTGGAQEERFRHGTGDLLHRIAEPFADRIVLNAPVQSVEQSATEVLVRTRRGEVRAKQVICTVPPPSAREIDFGSAVSTERLQLFKLMPLGETIKCMAVYERPFWRDEGLSGQAFAAHLPVTATFDNSVPGVERGILLGFYVGPQATAARPLEKSARRERFLRSLARYYGEKALRPLVYHELVWKNEPWSGGCYSGYFPKGVWTTQGEHLRRPSGRVHWAGTETAEKWNGYIEGAILSGERAADEVLASNLG